MTDDGQGIFTATLQLTPDIYHYKFFADGSRWFLDPAADKRLEDKEDHGNSGVLVGTDARQFPPPLPNHIESLGLAHDLNSVVDSDVASNSQLRLRVRTQAQDVQKVLVLYRTDPKESWKQQQIFSITQKWGFEYFGGVVTFPAATQVQYLFQLTDGDATRYLASSFLYSQCKDS